MSDPALPTSDGRSLRWEGHREKRRAELVHIALSVIDREGPGATVEQIAESARVSRQVLYRQFDDRVDLDTAIAEAVATMLLEHLSERSDASKGIEPGLRGALDAYLDWVEQNQSLYWFIRAREADQGTSQAVRRVRDNLVGVVAATAEALLEAAKRESPIPVLDVFAVGAVGLADAVVSNWLTGTSNISREGLVDALVALIASAIGSVLPHEPTTVER